MSYRPEKQAIAPGLEKIAAGIEEYATAVRERLRDSGEWAPDHLEDVNALRLSLEALEPKVHRLLQESW